MARHEFSKATKRAALRRSGGHCEATGSVYGLDPGQRCDAPLSQGVEFDHYPVPATERDSNGLENCVACCPTCHGRKTRTFDIPIQAKTKRVSDRHLGVVKPSGGIQSRGFPKPRPQHSATTPPTKVFRRVHIPEHEDQDV